MGEAIPPGAPNRRGGAPLEADADAEAIFGNRIRDRLRRLPKTELHVHLDGSLRPATMLDLAAEIGVPMPRDDPKALGRYMRAPEGGTLGQYLERFDLTLAVLQRAEALERVAFELAEDLAHESVRYAEVRFSPILNTRDGLSMDGVVAAVAAGLERAERVHGIRANIIICAIRSLDPAMSLRLAEIAVDHAADRVVGFDLAGPEAGHPASVHQAAFQRVRREEIGLTIHAGEAAGAESIRDAIHECGARRIGHGTRLIEDRRLMHFVRDFAIPVEACLTSNVQTGAVPSLEEHPLRTYLRSGLQVSLNTDNRLVSATTLTEEYAKAGRSLGCSWTELCELALAGFESAFLPLPERQAMIERARAEIDVLDSEGDGVSP